MSSLRFDVAVIGAGLAGTACAYRLTQDGARVALLEASDRVGGRCWSETLPSGQVFEHGGELIDASHHHLHGLIREFGLEVEDRAAAPESAETVLLDGGVVIDPATLEADYARFLDVARDAADAMGSYHFAEAGDEARRIDALSVAGWLVEQGYRPGTRFWNLIESIISVLLGTPIDRLSAITLLRVFHHPMFGGSSDTGGEPLALSGVGDWGAANLVRQQHVRGGNDQIVAGMAARVPDGTLRLRAPVSRVARGSDGIELELEGAASVAADRVVFACPPTALRRIDLTQSGLGPAQRAFVDEIELGQNCKLLLRFDEQARERWPGVVVGNRPLAHCWETSRCQPGELLVTYYTGSRPLRAAAAHGMAPSEAASVAVATLEVAVPGLSRQFRGAYLDSWPDDPLTSGSYSCWQTGQVTRFWGLLEAPDGPYHFAGEHTTTYAKGYLEGAVASGERAARAILAGPVV